MSILLSLSICLTRFGCQNRLQKSPRVLWAVDEGIEGYLMREAELFRVIRPSLWGTEGSVSFESVLDRVVTLSIETEISLSRIKPCMGLGMKNSGGNAHGSSGKTSSLMGSLHLKALSHQGFTSGTEIEN